MWGKSCKKG